MICHQQLHNDSALRDCDDSSFIFVEGKNQSLFKISNGGSIRLDIQSEQIFKPLNSIPQLNEVNFSNEHRQDSKVSVPTLLRMLSENREKANSYLTGEKASVEPLVELGQKAKTQVNKWVHKKLKPWIIYGSILGGLAAFSVLALIYFKVIAPKLKKNEQKAQNTVNNVEVKLDLGDIKEKGKMLPPPSPKTRFNPAIIENVRHLYDEKQLPKETTSFLLLKEKGGKETSVKL